MLPLVRTPVTLLLWLTLLLPAMTLAGCDSPPRMWGKRINQALNERPPAVPRQPYERAASDAATAEAYARLCGFETKAMEPAMRSFFDRRDVQRPDILWDSYRLRRDRLVEENQAAVLYPGECWQRGQDFDSVLAAVKAGDMPRYEGLDLWQ